MPGGGLKPILCAIGRRLVLIHLGEPTYMDNLAHPNYVVLLTRDSKVRQAINANLNNKPSDMKTVAELYRHLKQVLWHAIIKISVSLKNILRDDVDEPAQCKQYQCERNSVLSLQAERISALRSTHKSLFFKHFIKDWLIKTLHKAAVHYRPGLMRSIARSKELFQKKKKAVGRVVRLIQEQTRKATDSDTVDFENSHIRKRKNSTKEIINLTIPLKKRKVVFEDYSDT
ncbi:hypothetical protein HDU67_008258 [Dinochytrium kinnereticum]|nr:hypothetical protein HDU67_008258 [Dinochytrium kinnereticum]